jgi:hypothetical protein
MKLPVIKKGYSINLDKIDVGYLYAEIATTAESIGKAKSQLMANPEIYGMTLKQADEEVNYLNIPVIRCKEADIVLFEGKETKRYKISEILMERERIAKLDEILNNPEIKYCYIRKGSYYRPNSSGYTDMRYRAGVYLKKDAYNSALSCRDLTIIPIDIEEHNKMIQDEINELSTRLFK